MARSYAAQQRSRERERREMQELAEAYAERLRALPREERENRLQDYICGELSNRLLGPNQKIELAALAILHQNGEA